MKLRKWRLNSTNLLQTVPAELKEEDEGHFTAAPEQCHKALGIHWHTKEDTLHVATPTYQETTQATETVIIDIARTFDALGWYSPAVVQLKILL